MKSGIYIITNIVNKKFYIGSAINLNKRRNQHFHYLRKNKHPNIYLQRSFNKYREENFEFNIIEFCNKEKLINREQYYIDTLKPNFNICKIAGSSIGRKVKLETITKMKVSHSKRNCNHSDETKLKISLSHKGKIISNEHKEKIRNTLSIPILQFNKNNEFIKEYPNSKSAIEEFNNNTSIILVLKGKRKTASGYKWKYKN